MGSQPWFPGADLHELVSRDEGEIIRGPWLLGDFTGVLMIERKIPEGQTYRACSEGELSIRNHINITSVDGSEIRRSPV